MFHSVGNVSKDWCVLCAVCEWMVMLVRSREEIFQIESFVQKHHSCRGAS